MAALDLIQIGGALLILGAFAGAQLRRLDVHSVPYLLLNIAGAGILTVLAAIGRDWGFLLLEGVWTIVSVIGLWGGLRRRPSPDQVS